MESTYNKPLPVPTIESKPYWEACRKHELRIQRCNKCGKYHHYPNAMCPYCHSFELEWAKVSGYGKVYSWVICYQAFHPGFAKEVPYVDVTVELDEGVRMFSRMVDVKPDEMEIGMPVEVVFEDVTPEFTLPMFRRSQEHKQ